MCIISPPVNLYFLGKVIVCCLVGSERIQLLFRYQSREQETLRPGTMSESVVFELKLQIQHLQDKVTFLAGGTNATELTEALMEKEEELDNNVSTDLLQ